ncbi:MAG: exodeoxyribonuclease VII large subunit [Planctomycetota bacterium]|nr:exodeoxyribonuclease VII large subunit [Planctomycetota bacterium]
MNDLFLDIENKQQDEKPLSVGELSTQIDQLLQSRIGRVEVVGQINGPKLGQHWYFSLVDEDAKIDCAMWASKTASVTRTGWRPKQGDVVHAKGTIGHYGKFGKTQLYVESLKLFQDEKGKLQQEFDALVKLLRGKGYFDVEHKLQLPEFPRKIAIVTSATSAAVQDVIATAKQRCPSVELLIVNVPVQGDASAPAVAKAISKIDKIADRDGIDAIIVTRGGGAMEDLWAFNDAAVAEATFMASVPIVAAIGHESDTTIIELVADVRASTPTQAVMALIPDREELLHMIYQLDVRMNQSMKQFIKHQSIAIASKGATLFQYLRAWIMECKQRVLTQSERLTASRPHARYQVRQKRLLQLDSSLQRGMTNVLQQKQMILTSASSRLEASSPSAVLKRGFSLTEDENGNIIRSIKQVQKDATIKTVVADGSIESKVECTHE